MRCILIRKNNSKVTIGLFFILKMENNKKSFFKKKFIIMQKKQKNFGKNKNIKKNCKKMMNRWFNA